MIFRPWRFQFDEVKSSEIIGSILYGESDMGCWWVSYAWKERMHEEKLPSGHPRTVDLCPSAYLDNEAEIAICDLNSYDTGETNTTSIFDLWVQQEPYSYYSTVIIS